MKNAIKKLFSRNDSFTPRAGYEPIRQVPVETAIEVLDVIHDNHFDARWNQNKTTQDIRYWIKDLFSDLSEYETEQKKDDVLETLKIIKKIVNDNY